MTAQITWFLIADGAHARVLETTGIATTLQPVPSMTLSADLPRSSVVGRDRPGRAHESVGTTRHAIEAKSDPHRQMKRAFATLIAEKLEAAVATHAFQRLAIAAPAKMLGDLRKALPVSVADRIVAEVAKDLVKTPDRELRDHFAALV